MAQHLLESSTSRHNGARYVPKTYNGWADEIGITTKAARGALCRLRACGVVVAIANPLDGRDRTMWWRIDYAIVGETAS